MNPDADPEYYSPEGPTKANKRSRGSGNKDKRQGGREGNAKRHASEKVIDEQVCIVLLCQDTVCHDISTGASS